MTQPGSTAAPPSAGTTTTTTTTTSKTEFDYRSAATIPLPMSSSSTNLNKGVQGKDTERQGEDEANRRRRKVMEVGGGRGGGGDNDDDDDDDDEEGGKGAQQQQGQKQQQRPLLTRTEGQSRGIVAWTSRTGTWWWQQFFPSTTAGQGGMRGQPPQYQYRRFFLPCLFLPNTPEGRETLRRQCVAEFFGTFLLIFLGLGAVMSAKITEALVGLFQVAAIWCFAVTTAIATVGPISGAHINPAISLAFCLLRPSPQFDWPQVLPYVVSQVLGAAVGAWVLFYMYGPEIAEYEQLHAIDRESPMAMATAGCFGSYYRPPVTLLRAFFTEVVSTAFLGGVVFALTHPDNDTTKRNVYIAPFIGICVASLICAMAPLTGASMNPARELGPRIVAYFAGWTNLAFAQIWLYLLAPCMGAPLGGFIADQILFNGYDDPTTSATGPTTTTTTTPANSAHHHSHHNTSTTNITNIHGNPSPPLAPED